MRERTRTFLESIVIGAIVLVLIQTFLEDFSVLAGWTWTVRRFLVVTGFAFDLFFTIEFLSRLYTAVFNGRGMTYFAKERGWIDFAASIPESRVKIMASLIRFKDSSAPKPCRANSTAASDTD